MMDARAGNQSAGDTDLSRNAKSPAAGHLVGLWGLGAN